MHDDLIGRELCGAIVLHQQIAADAFDIDMPSVPPSRKVPAARWAREQAW
jgi:hypothetical protein